jgi:hypothetical protein
MDTILGRHNLLESFELLTLGVQPTDGAVARPTGRHEGNRVYTAVLIGVRKRNSGPMHYGVS